jgi:hypothetical protein
MSEQAVIFEFLEYCEVAAFTTQELDRVSVLACRLCSSLVWDVAKHMERAHGVAVAQSGGPVTAEALARAWWIQEAVDGGSRPGSAEQTWDDMGGSEPTAERARYVLRAEEVLHALTGLQGN